jgi:hypothetical protein
MIFERELCQIPSSWNIFGDTFFWQEKGNLTNIYVLQCADKNVHSKLFKINIESIEAANFVQTFKNSNFKPNPENIERGIGYSHGNLIVKSGTGILYT